MGASGGAGRKLGPPGPRLPERPPRPTILLRSGFPDGATGKTGPDARISHSSPEPEAASVVSPTRPRPYGAISFPQPQRFTIARRRSRRPQPARREPDVNINENIRANKVRVVIDGEGQKGVMPTEEAIDMARNLGLDLVEISPNSDPPVTKIMDYGKYRYEQQKKAKEQRKKQAGQGELKEVRFRPRTDDHDYEFKLKHAREFLEKGNKVKAWVQFRGRDIIYKDQGLDMLERFTEDLSDIAKVDQAPTMEGRRMTTMLTPDKK
jgi:translation initiation factor IF-3